MSHGPAIEDNAFSPVCRPMFKVLWSLQGRKSQLLHTCDTYHTLLNVWSVLIYSILHPPFNETQSLVSSAKCDTCHMALPLKIMHFRLCVGLCLKYCGALSDVNYNYFTHFIYVL